MLHNFTRLVVISLLCVAFSAKTAAAGQGVDVSHFPPWQSGANNPSNDKGLEFTVREADNLADFHGDLASARLLLYVGGNYFFAMAPLVAAFEQDHPDLKGEIYYETIPPGLLAKQMRGRPDNGRQHDMDCKARRFFRRARCCQTFDR